jgi:hypothetical protein
MNAVTLNSGGLYKDVTDIKTAVTSGDLFKNVTDVKSAVTGTSGLQAIHNAVTGTTQGTLFANVSDTKTAVTGGGSDSIYTKVGKIDGIGTNVNTIMAAVTGTSGVSAIHTAVTLNSGGLYKDVTDIKTAVTSNSGGLYKDVTYIKTAVTTSGAGGLYKNVDDIKDAVVGGGENIYTKIARIDGAVTTSGALYDKVKTINDAVTTGSLKTINDEVIAIKTSLTSSLTDIKNAVTSGSSGTLYSHVNDIYKTLYTDTDGYITYKIGRIYDTLKASAPDGKTIWDALWSDAGGTKTIWNALWSTSDANSIYYTLTNTGASYIGGKINTMYTNVNNINSNVSTIYSSVYSQNGTNINYLFGKVNVLYNLLVTGGDIFNKITTMNTSLTGTGGAIHTALGLGTDTDLYERIIAIDGKLDTTDDDTIAQKVEQILAKP